jgi:hypothetical protein
VGVSAFVGGRLRGLSSPVHELIIFEEGNEAMRSETKGPSKLVWGVALFLAVSLFTGGDAAAALTQTYILDHTSESALPAGPTYGTVTVTADATLGTVTFRFDVNPSAVPNPGPKLGMFEVGLNTTLTSAQLSATQISIDDSNFSGPNLKFSPSGGTNKLGGFQNFNIDFLAKNQKRTTPVTVTIQGLGALATISNFATTNGSQSTVFFAAHEVGFNTTGGVTSAFIGGSTPQSVTATPEPSTVVAAVTGLIPLGLVWLRRSRHPSADAMA